jgi:flagellar biogenesis protein FliO
MSLKKAQVISTAPAVAPQGTVFQAILRQFWKNLVGWVGSARIQRRTKRMEVLERVSIGAKQSVLLLRLDGQEFVVGCSGENLVLLGTREFSGEFPTPVQDVPAQEVKAARKPRKKRALNLRTPSAAELLREFQGSIQ